VLNFLADRPTHSMTFDAICLALRPRFFGKLKKGDYDKAIKQLLKNDKVRRQQKGLRPKLLPHEVISLPAAR
jgi:hypothetical protein